MEKSIRRNENQHCCYRNLKNNGKRVIWEITGRCNLRCKHCFVSKDEKAEDIDLALALEICRELCDQNIDKVMITGGEPLLYDYIFDVVEYLKKNSAMVVDITTNGLLLDDEKINTFQRLGVDELSVSIDGPQEVYEMMRGIDGVSRLFENVRKLVGAGISVDGIMTLNRINYDYVSETVELAFRNGFSSLTISNLLKLQNSDFDYTNLYLGPEKIAEFERLLSELRKKYATRLPIRSVGFLGDQEADFDKCYKKNIYAINRNGYALKCLNSKFEKTGLLDLRNYKLEEAIEILDRRDAVNCLII